MNLQVCPDPIFLIGSPRSGTSILSWALSQHSRLWTSVESNVFSELFADDHAERAFAAAVARPDGRDWLIFNGVDQDEFLAHLGLGLNALVTSRSGGLRWVDQSPRNTLIADTLAKLFPRAAFVHLLRDGRRVVHSMTHFANALNDPRNLAGGRLPGWATDFAVACRTWRQFVETARDFAARHPDRSLTVLNEALVKDEHGAVFGAIFDFLGVPHEPAPLAYFQANRINSSFPTRSSLGGEVLWEPWTDWSGEQLETFWAEAGSVMVASGLAARDDHAVEQIA